MDTSGFKIYPGFGGRYMINDCGDALSFARTKPIKLKPHLALGYLSFLFYNEDGSTKRVRVNRAVALLFIPNPDNKPEVNHKDGNKLNNHYSNLEWVTSSENSLHAYEIGLQDKKGEKHHFVKLSDDQIRSIRSEYKGIRGQGIMLSEKYNVCRPLISMIVNNKIWTHV